MNENEDISNQETSVTIIRDPEGGNHFRMSATNREGLELSIIPNPGPTRETHVEWDIGQLQAAVFSNDNSTSIAGYFTITSKDMNMNTEDKDFWEELRKYGERFSTLDISNLSQDEIWQTVFPDIIDDRENRK